MKSLISTLLLLSIPSITFGFSAGAHRIIAEIAWQKMGKGTRQQTYQDLQKHLPSTQDFLVKMPKDTSDIRQQTYQILQKHPRYAQDFLAKMPDSVRSGDDLLKARWVFHQAAVWPDTIRTSPPTSPPLIRNQP